MLDARLDYVTFYYIFYWILLCYILFHYIFYDVPWFSTALHSKYVILCSMMVYNTVPYIILFKLYYTILYYTIIPRQTDILVHGSSLLAVFSLWLAC